MNTVKPVDWFSHSKAHIITLISGIVFIHCSVYKRFTQLNPDLVGQNKNAKLSQDDILSLPELKVMIMLSYSDSTIRKTCPCNVYPLEPHFYIAKLGYAGVYLFFLFLLQNIDCGYSLEPPTIYVLSKNKKKYF